MTHEEAFMQAIVESPDDDAPRLVYADWLEDNGQPERAEFIRVQCRLASLNEWDEGHTELSLRAARLAEEHGDSWAGSADEAGRGRSPPFGRGDLIRGFVGRASYPSGLTAAAAREHFARHPISELEIIVQRTAGSRPRLRRLATDFLPGLRTLKLDLQYACSPETAEDACRTFAGAKCRRGLTRLEIDGNPTVDGLEAVVASPNLGGLETLSVRGDGVGDAHARRMVAKADLPRLRELILGHRGLTPAGADALAGAAWFSQLATVRLFGHEWLGDEGATRLLSGRPLPALRTIHLHHCGLTGNCLPAFGDPGLASVVELILAGGYGIGQGWEALTAGPQRYLSLEVEGACMSGPDAAAFFGGSAGRSLRRLWLTNSSLGSDAVAALAGSPLPGTLRVLHLSCETDADPGARALVSGPAWPHLARLCLHGFLSDDALLALVESPNFARVVSLTARCDRKASVFLKWLAHSPAAARLRELDLVGGMTPEAARELAGSPYLDGLDRLHLFKGRADQAGCEELVRRFGGRVQIQDYTV